MEDKFSIDRIEKDDFQNLLEKYAGTITNTKLQALDQQRLDMPETVKQRGKEAHLTKSELVTLMDWKLAHGKFRPMLKKLIQENDDENVQKVTKDAFQHFSKSSPPAEAQVKEVINKLSAFRGVGPATASLLLSTYDPENAPFFSDELFRWCFWQSGRGSGWDRDIKYNVKEYLQLFTVVQQLTKRLNISCLDVEKVAYVLARQFPGESSTNDVSIGQKRKAPTDSEVASKAKAESGSIQKTKQPKIEESVSQRRSTRSRKKS